MNANKRWYTSDRGPTSPHYQGSIACEETGRTIAITYDDEGGSKAHLIASAPELLESASYALGNLVALESMVLPRNMKVQINLSIQYLRDAIAKAENRY